MASNAIEIREVSRRFGPVCAVDGVSLDIFEGETLGLIGHNGAGKSTLFKMMLGLIPPSSGQILIQGTQVHGAAFRALRRAIGYLPENLAFYENLTGLETLRFFARLKGCGQEQCMALLKKLGLEHAANRRVDGYSKGMRQRLGFAQALLGSPRILFLDEPTNGLDPEGIREFYDILGELKQTGVTVIITSHILFEIQERVQRLAVMKSGKLHALGTVQQLREEVNLPLTVHLRLSGSPQRVRDALAGIPLESLEAQDGHVMIRCMHQHRMELLRRLYALEGLDDITVREPSLEDIFLGYAA
ncbi:MAG: ABC transporter ATP-binding protein [Methylobacillus sp.]|nr:ABC transporter ATP-binding protein [Methylobacillus sp.]